MKRVLLFFLLTLPVWANAQNTLTNGSFSNGYVKGWDGNITATSLVGSSGLLMADVPQMRASAFLPSGKTLIPNLIPPFVAGIDSTGIGEPVSISFFVENAGSADLTIDTVIIAGVNASEFTLDLNGFMKKVIPTSATGFNIQFSPASLGLRAALISIYSNDPQNQVYSFIISGKGDLPHPTIPASSLLATNITDQSMHFIWKNGNGSKRVVLVSDEGKVVPATPPAEKAAPAQAEKEAPAQKKKASKDLVTVTDGTLLTGNSDYELAPEYDYGGLAWKVIYVGIDSAASVTNLKALTNYEITVIEFNGDSALTKYLNHGAPLITQQTLDSLQAPTIPASNLTFSSVTSSQALLTFNKGNGSNRLVVIKPDSPVDFVPSNDSTYYINQLIGTNRIVMNDTLSSVTVTGLQPNTIYYATIFEYNNEGTRPMYLTAGEPSVFTATLTLTPTLFSASSGDGKNIVLIWNHTAAIANRVFQVINGNNVQIGTTIGDVNSFTVANTIPGAIYEFLVASVNLLNVSVLSSPVSLTTHNPPPSTPASNITFTNVFSTQMQLAFVPGNGTNHLVVIKAGSAVDFVPINNTTYDPGDAGNGNTIVSIGNNTSIALSGLIPSTTYFAKVFEYNNYSSLPQYLITGVPSASQATLPLPSVYVITPANGAINQNVTLNVTSIALTGAATYTIELNDAADFSGISFVKSGSRTQNFSGLIYGKIYFARVKTNLSPDYGKVTSFTTSVPIVQVTTPANGALNQNTKLNVTATSLAGASVYTIELNEAADFTGASIIQSGARTQNFAGLKYDQQYFTRVMTDNYPVFGPSSSFRTAIPNVYVINPANGDINQSVSLNVTANAFTGATTYTIELNTAADFSGRGFVQTGGRTQGFSGLSFDTTYYARVKTDLSPVYGKVTSFNTAPASWFAYVTSPANNAVNINNTTLNITSNVVPYASTYTIQLSEAFDFSTVAFEVSGNSRTLPLSGLKYNTTYYNRVTTDVSTGYGQVRSFTTRTAESISYVVSPANNASNVSYNVNVRSNLVPGANTYTIELNTASDFTGNSMIQSSSSNTIAFNNLQYNTTYYNRVKTDMSPNWGATRSFTTGDPSMFSYIVSPANLSTNVKWVVNLTSNTVPNASLYTIEANTAADFTGVSIVKIGSRTQGFTLDQHITYYVRVKTDLYSGWGPSRFFSTGDAVSLAYVTSPVDGAAGVPTTVSVVANALPGATNYTIELNTASDYSGTRLVNSGGRTHSFAGLDQNTTYYTRVQSNLAPGLWGPQGSFTTINPAARIEGDWVGSDGDTTVVSGNSLKVFPNPFADKFSMLVEDLEQIEIDIQLIDLNGVVLKSWKGETNRFIEVKEELVQGLYILKVTRRHEVLVAKMLKL